MAMETLKWFQHVSTIRWVVYRISLAHPGPKKGVPPVALGEAPWRAALDPGSQNRGLHRKST